MYSPMDAAITERLFSMLMNGIEILSPLEQMASDLRALGCLMEVLAATPLLDLDALQGWNAGFEWNAFSFTSLVQEPDGRERVWSYYEFSGGAELPSSKFDPDGTHDYISRRSLLIPRLFAAWSFHVKLEREALGRSWQNGQQAADP